MDRMHFRYPLSTIAILVVASTALITRLPIHAVSGSGYYYREFEWNYGGFRWTWNLTISKSLYNTYQTVSISERVRNGPAGYGFLVTTEDSYVVQLANKLHEGAIREGYDAFDEVSFILAFVQSLPYTSDDTTTGFDEYPRFPVETLVDGGGDCEDTSILFATITLILNYDTIFISPPNHYAVGIWGTNLIGSYYTYNNRRYYYCETTGNNWRIGQIPDEYKDVSAYLYNINENAQYVPGQDIFGQNVPPILKTLIVWMFVIGLSAGLAGIFYVLRRRAKKREAQEVPPQPPPLPSQITTCKLETVHRKMTRSARFIISDLLVHLLKKSGN